MSTRRDELVRTAARLFAERGFHGTSMGDIADAMGVQKGSLYSLTESKQALLADAMRRGAAAFHDALDGMPEDGPALERIRVALRGHLRVVAGQLDVATVFTREWRYLEGEQRDAFVAERRRYEERWRALFREGVEQRRVAHRRRHRGGDAARPLGRQLGVHVAATRCGHRRARRPVHRAPRRRHPRLRIVGRCLRLSYPQVGNPLARIPNRVEAPAARVSKASASRPQCSSTPQGVGIRFRGSRRGEAPAARVSKASASRPQCSSTRKVWVSASADPRRGEAPTARIPKGVPFGAAILFSPAGGYPLSRTPTAARRLRRGTLKAPTARPDTDSSI